MASPYKALQWCVKNNSETVGHIDLRLGQIVYISVFCDISSTGWFPVYFFVLCLLRDSENHLQGLVRTFFMVDIEWTNFKKVMSHSLNFSMEMSRMHQHLENWNDMKHELRKFCLADFFFLIYAKLFPYTISDGESQTFFLPVFLRGGGSVHRLLKNFLYCSEQKKHLLE